jgi:hypothetical protein
MYIDGQALGQDNGRSTLPASSHDFVIGATNEGGTNVKHFDGLLDDVRVWNVARTQAQIQASKNSELLGTESGLVGYWKFGNNPNATGSTNPLTLNNGATYAATSPFVSLAPPTGPNTPPTISLSGANPLTLIQGAPYIEPGFTATDPEDGLITSKVISTTTLNINVPGNYVVNYMVTDLGNVSTTTSRAVAVIAPPPPSNTHRYQMARKQHST